MTSDQTIRDVGQNDGHMNFAPENLQKEISFRRKPYLTHTLFSAAKAQRRLIRGAEGIDGNCGRGGLPPGGRATGGITVGGLPSGGL